MFTKKQKTIYLDYAATTPVRREVFDVMKPWLDGTSFGNPSAIHERGKYAKKIVATSRKEVKSIIGAHASSNLIFTSGGTESNTMAIMGVIKQHRSGTIITTQIEHPSITYLLESLPDSFNVISLSVNSQGVVSLKELEDALLNENNIVLASIMMVNNEIGSIQPISKISKAIKNSNKDIHVHTDASQAPLYLSCNVQSLNVDSMSLCGQKIYGPQGSGALYVKKGVTIEPLFIGGSQEYGLRAGTEPVHQIVGFTKALELAHLDRESYGKKMFELKNYFLSKSYIFKGELNGSDDSLPLAINISFLNSKKSSEEIVSYLNIKDIHVSSKSACMGSKEKDSYVIDALNLDRKNSIRFSFGMYTTRQDIDTVISVLKRL